MTDTTSKTQASDAKKRPAFQFYPESWRTDAELRSCSLAARGLWIDLMCVMHQCKPYGHLVLANGAPMRAEQIVNQIGGSVAQVKKLLEELLANGVARRTDGGVIFSKRMVDDERVRNIKAEIGKANGSKGAEFGNRGAEHGKKGGRPSTKNPPNNPPTKPPQEPGENPPPLSPSPSLSPEEESNRHTEYLGFDDDEVPADWLRWDAFFEAEYGVEHDVNALTDRRRFRPLADGWTKAGISCGLMRRAVGKARAEAKEPIAYLPGYVDRVLATMTAPTAPGRATRNAERNAYLDRLTGQDLNHAEPHDVVDVDARLVG